jgi:hypothetical protein
VPLRRAGDPVAKLVPDTPPFDSPSLAAEFSAAGALMKKEKRIGIDFETGLNESRDASK